MKAASDIRSRIAHITEGRACCVAAIAAYRDTGDELTAQRNEWMVTIMDARLAQLWRQLATADRGAGASSSSAPQGA